MTPIFAITVSGHNSTLRLITATVTNLGSPRIALRNQASVLSVFGLHPSSVHHTLHKVVQDKLWLCRHEVQHFKKIYL